MNDVIYLEAARKLAERMMKQGGQTPAERIAFAFRLATARAPKPAETDVLCGLFDRLHTHFGADRESAAKFLAQGESPRDETLDAGELASYASIAGLILNLDETITKE